MYNWCTAVEGLKDSGALRKSLESQRQRSFDTQIRTLAALCECFSVCTEGGCIIPETTMSWEVLRARRRSDDVLVNLLPVFDMADANCDGYIKIEELRLIAKRLRFDLDLDALNLFVDQAKAAADLESPSPCSIDGDCFLSFTEFATVVLNQQAAPQISMSEREVSRRVFAFFDIDLDGAVTIREMTDVLVQMGFEDDAPGTEQLFCDMTGKQRDMLSTEQFADYFAKVMGHDVQLTN